MKDKVIGLRKPKRVSKAHENAKLGKGPKWAKDAQRNQKSSNDYTKSLREE